MRGTHRLALAVALLSSMAGVATLPAGAQQQGAVPIGEVQGAVGDDVDGRAHTSPLVGETVEIQGVIHDLTLAGGNHGFFVQDTAGTRDTDPHTSDGVFVFHGGFDTLRVDEDRDGQWDDGRPTYVPEPGDEVVLRGPVTEFFELTQLSNPFLVEVVREGVDLDEELAAAEVDPPADDEEAGRYWERLEGMRVQVPAGSVAVTGRRVFGDETGDAETWVVRGDSVWAQRSDPYTRRVFRDPHPLDDEPATFDNLNGHRIAIGSSALKADLGATARVAPTRTFDTVVNDPVGGLYYSFGKYQIMVGQQLDLAEGVDPAANAPFASFDRDAGWSASVYNVENLYDFRDDPTDGCDFRGNDGCPGVTPPFDYAPASEDDYQAKLDGIAVQIAEDLHGPDVLLVQEAEDQDICAIEDGALACGGADDGDGEPDTLQELALRLEGVHGLSYGAALDRDGADDRGIVSGFLYRTDRIDLLPADPDDPVLGSDPRVAYPGDGFDSNADVSNPKALNAVLPDGVASGDSCPEEPRCVFTRAPQVAKLRIRPHGGVRAGVPPQVVYLVSNHFSSGPDRRVGQRTEQASYNAAIVDALQEHEDAEVRVVVGGDFNTFPRPDDPLAPDGSSDQLGALYEQGLTNVHDLLLERAPSAAYSYVFEGQAQTLDSMFVTDSVRRRVGEAAASHVNADWPAADADRFGPGRGVSDHDPVSIRLDMRVGRRGR